MITAQLEALLIDQALGELPVEVEAVLEAFLSSNPDRGAEARAIRESLSESLQLTGEVVARCPELFATAESASPTARGITIPGASLLKIAAVFLALVLAAGAGYRTGREAQGRPSGDLVKKTVPVNRAESPWARYVVAADGGLAVVPAQPGS